MKTVQVKFIESIAGLADPEPKETLDARYEAKRSSMKSSPKPLSDKTISDIIARIKVADRYAEKPLGFRRDWSFRPGDEGFINPELAATWEEAGICRIVSEHVGK